MRAAYRLLAYRAANRRRFQHLIDEIFLAARLLGVLVFPPFAAIFVGRRAGLGAGRPAVRVVGCHSRLRRRLQICLPRGIVLRTAREGDQDHKHRRKPHDDPTTAVMLLRHRRISLQMQPQRTR